MALVVVAAGGWLAYTKLNGSSCTGSVQLNVAAAPEIAPAVKTAADSWVKNGANNNGTCVAVAVSSVTPWQMAARIAEEHKVSLAGVGDAPDTVQVPDVWISDSSTWLMRLRAEAPGFAPSDSQPVAQSPVVLAVPEPIAQKFLGWPNKKLKWTDLAVKMQATAALQTGIVNPTKDAVGLSGLLAFGQAAGAGGQDAKVTAVKNLAASASAVRDDLLSKFPTSNDQTALLTGLAAAPLSEQAVIAYNAQRPGVQLAAIYMDPNPLPMDYPYAVMPEAELNVQQTAAAFHNVLRSPDFGKELAAAGLRAPDGSEGPGFQAPTGAPAASPAVTPSAAGGDSAGVAAGALDADTLSQALGSWTAITLPGRVLAVFDVSGSMNKPVPTAGKGATRMTVTKGAALRGLSLFDSKWDVGMWKFATGLAGGRPYEQLVKIGPLATNQQDLATKLAGLQPNPKGDTGLFNTAVAAYTAVKATWQPGKVNSVILFTDGLNDFKAGYTDAQMRAEFKKIVDPTKPVRMVLIGIGDEVSEDQLQSIADASGYGGVYVAKDPTTIDSIFLRAIGSRSGANN